MLAWATTFRPSTANGVGERLQQACCGRPRLGLAGALDQDGELVTTEARHGVRRAEGAGQTIGHLDEQRVAGGVTEAVVDRLEAVEVEQHHRDRGVAPGQRVLQPVVEQRSVRQPGEHVVEREMDELLLRGLALGDVLQRSPHLRHAARPRRRRAWHAAPASARRRPG